MLLIVTLATDIEIVQRRNNLVRHVGLAMSCGRGIVIGHTGLI